MDDIGRHTDIQSGDGDDENASRKNDKRHSVSLPLFFDPVSIHMYMSIFLHFLFVKCIAERCLWAFFQILFMIE